MSSERLTWRFWHRYDTDITHGGVSLDEPVVKSTKRWTIYVARHAPTIQWLLNKEGYNARVIHRPWRNDTVIETDAPAPDVRRVMQEVR